MVEQKYFRLWIPISVPLYAFAALQSVSYVMPESLEPIVETVTPYPL